MKTSLLAMLLLSVGFAAPAAAESTASCREIWIPQPSDPAGTTTEINQRTPQILAGLKAKGLDIDDISDWGGCVRADVETGDGHVKIEFFDPDTLQQLTVN